VAAQTPAPAYEGPTLADPAPAPGLVLHDYLGHRVDLSGYRGRAVLVTFIYTHCPDVCPLIVASLHNALDMLGPAARKVAVIGVSTDPRGDTRTAITAFLAERGMLGRMQYLVGSRSALTPVWRAWGINASNPTATDEVAHTAVVYGITGSGRIVTAYPSNFTPAQIAHDVPLLATQ
jgi:protein SCO1/2